MFTRPGISMGKFGFSNHWLLILYWYTTKWYKYYYSIVLVNRLLINSLWFILLLDLGKSLVEKLQYPKVNGLVMRAWKDGPAAENRPAGGAGTCQCRGRVSATSGDVPSDVCWFISSIKPPCLLVDNLHVCWMMLLKLIIQLDSFHHHKTI
jgi:hypothetical protein